MQVRISGLTAIFFFASTVILILREYNLFGLTQGFNTTLVSLVSIDARSEKAVDCSEIFGMMLKVGNAARIEAENFQ